MTLGAFDYVRLSDTSVIADWKLRKITSLSDKGKTVSSDVAFKDYLVKKGNDSLIRRRNSSLWWHSKSSSEQCFLHQPRRLFEQLQPNHWKVRKLLDL